MWIPQLVNTKFIRLCASDSVDCVEMCIQTMKNVVHMALRHTVEWKKSEVDSDSERGRGEDREKQRKDKKI